ncbi:MAG: benenodin family lasso peptide [Thermomicrobiales bacterium]
MNREDNSDVVIELGQASVLTEGNGQSGGDGAGQRILSGLSDD